MRALLSIRAGGPDTLVLREVNDPRPGPAEVLISVQACGVNYPDLLIIDDRYQARPERPFAPGSEIAGIVESIGERVTQFQPGDRVMGQLTCGGMAEKAVVPESKCIRMPSSMSFEQASAFQITFGTTYYALKQRAHLQPRDTLLVLGAAGGVGLAAVQIGAALGARVIAACSSAEKLDLCRRQGAQDGLVYPSGPWDKEGKRALAGLFKEACGQAGANVIYDAVGGDYSEAALRAIAWNGRFLVIGFPAGIAALPLNLALLKGCDIAGVFWGAWIEREPRAHQQNMLELLSLFDSGKIAPHMSAVYSLEDGSRALDDLAGRRAQGKVVIRCG
jgi:NADPH2:quinone reductase